MPHKDPEVRRAWFRARYHENQRRIQQYKLARGCADCGYNKLHYVLEFDHIEPHLFGTVARQMNKSWTRILQEAKRCEVVCGNCHNIRTWKRRQAANSGDDPLLPD